MFVVARVSYKSSLEECNVEDGRVEVDELEEEDFERQVVVKLGLGSMHLWNFVFEILFLTSTGPSELWGFAIAVRDPVLFMDRGCLLFGWVFPFIAHQGRVYYGNVTNVEWLSTPVCTKSNFGRLHLPTQLPGLAISKMQPEISQHKRTHFKLDFMGTDWLLIIFIFYFFHNF